MGGLRSKTEAFDFGYYGLFRFLTPHYNWRMVDRFYSWVGQTIRSHTAVDLDRYDRRPSVVAHSLGSWIVGYAMLKHADLRFDKLILAGSILPRDFDWGTLFARDQVGFVRNECGLSDPWPRWARRLVGYSGTGGSEGFDWFGNLVENVPCEWFGHSDSLMRQHIERCWIPTLCQRPSPLVVRHGREIHD
jgi:pimeloyl-ACP methyl ester carboxylesterase